MGEAVGHPLSAPPHHHTLSLSEFALISPHWSGLPRIFPFSQGVRRGYGIFDNVVGVSWASWAIYFLPFTCFSTASL